jgi:hypothetical protein
MRYWWIVQKRDGLGGLSLTPDEAAEYMEAKRHRDSFLLERIGLFMDTVLYGDCEVSAVPYVEGVGFLEAGEKPEGEVISDKVIMCLDTTCPGHKGALARWVKRRMPYRLWENTYSKLGGHYILHRDEDNEHEVWIANTRIVRQSERDPKNLPYGLYLLEAWEKDLLRGRAPVGTR